MHLFASRTANMGCRVGFVKGVHYVFNEQVIDSVSSYTPQDEQVESKSLHNPEKLHSSIYWLVYGI